MTEQTEKKLYELFEEHNANVKNPIEPEAVIKLVDAIKNTVEENSYNGKVHEFMATFKQQVNFAPIVPSNDLVKLRLNLLLEELCELAAACGSTAIANFIIAMDSHKTKLHALNTTPQFEDIKECLDAFVDLQYILSGGVHAFGLGNVFDAAFENVHESNMSKLCLNLDELEDTQDYYLKEKIATTFDEVNFKGITMYLVKRAEDGKVLKNVHYKKANFDKLLDPIIYGKTNL